MIVFFDHKGEEMSRSIHRVAAGHLKIDFFFLWFKKIVVIIIKVKNKKILNFWLNLMKKFICWFKISHLKALPDIRAKGHKIKIPLMVSRLRLWKKFIFTFASNRFH